LSTHLRLGLPSGLFLSGFPTNILHEFLFYLCYIYGWNNVIYTCIVGGGIKVHSTLRPLNGL
jgi:hypothetical protein